MADLPAEQRLANIVAYCRRLETGRELYGRDVCQRCLCAGGDHAPGCIVGVILGLAGEGAPTGTVPPIPGDVG